MSTPYPLTVFYDGACGVCSTEICFYRSIADQRIQFVDIAADNFNAGQYGKTLGEFQEKLHVMDAKGQFFTGVEAFRRLWEGLPSPFYPLLAGFVGLPGIHMAACACYAVFARFRHLLPSSKTAKCPIAKDQ
jgi:predicted DCC family thiol-disulfide oxidoreductase YuxK